MTSPNESNSPFNFNKLQSIDGETVRNSFNDGSLMEKTYLQKVNELKIRVGDTEYVEVPSNFSVTPKNQKRISVAHVESVSSYADPMKPKLMENHQDTAIKRHIGRQSALIEQILSAGSAYKNRSNSKSGYKTNVN